MASSVPDMERDVEREAELVAVPAEEGAREDEMGGARDWQELGESLHDAEHDGLEDHRARGYDARTFRPGFRGRVAEGDATSATLSACCARRTLISRRLRMMAIVAAMNTVE